VLAAARRLGFHIALVTSARRSIAEGVLDRHDVRKLFDAIITGDDVERAKPSPDLFLKAIDALGPGSYLAIDDSPLGVQAARAAGAAVIQFGTKWVGSDQPAVLTFTELLPILTRAYLARAGVIRAAELDVVRIEMAPRGAAPEERRPDEGPTIFNGEALVVHSVDVSPSSAVVTCAKTRYLTRRAAQARGPAWARPVSVAVSGVIRDGSGAYLLGRRGASVSDYPKAWEFVPSGGLDHSTSPEDQLLIELEEESGISRAAVRRVTPLGLVFDDASSCLDLCYEIELSSPLSLSDLRSRADEYSEFRLVAGQDLASLRSDDRVVPACAAMMDELVASAAARR
jgi:hypothetical protein